MSRQIVFPLDVSTFTGASDPRSWEEHYGRETMWFGVRAGQMSEEQLQRRVDGPFVWHSMSTIARAELRRRRRLAR